MSEPLTTQRVDKWLWVARFFKTRSLAAQAVSGGKVQLDGNRVKPAKQVGPGARLRIRRGSIEWDIVIQALREQRAGAPQAQLLYEETPQSVLRRQEESARRREQRIAHPSDMNRPDKKGRRELLRMKRPGT